MFKIILSRSCSRTEGGVKCCRGWL